MCTLFLLLVLYQIKHFLCDFPLQTPYMLGKFKKYPDFIKPLLAHAAVHGLTTLLIALWFKPEMALLLAMFDACTHFVVDRIKANPSLLGRFKALSGRDYVELAKDKAISERIIRSGAYSQTERTSEKEVLNDINKKFKSNVYFWWALGADQAAHHLTHYFVIWCLL